MVEEAVRERGFEIIEQIGAGGFGAVYRAHQPSVGRDVAIKVILPDIARDPLFIRRFEKEAQLAAQLEHPNIVPLYDYWRDEERAYLVMRWIRGGTLKESLADGPWELAEAILLVNQIASALETAHNQGVVHRDLKPSNIMLDEMGNAYLTDFGIAKYLVGATIDTPKGAIIGSPAYMAPEQIRGGEISPKSDLYSLGGLIYEVLTGEPPFGLDDQAALLYRQLHEPLPLVCEKHPDLPPAVDTVLQKATAKDPAERYPDVSILAEAFAVAIHQPEQITADHLLIERVLNSPHSLPVHSTPFVGREAELAVLERLLDDPEKRLVTIVGPGGMGKTRLALAAAERQLEIHRDQDQDGTPRFPDGVFFVPLDGLETPDQIAPETARSMGLRLLRSEESGGGMDGLKHTPKEQLLDYLSNKRLLLVLDNFEHLLEGATLIAEIRQRAPAVQLLVTSREKLGLHGEQLYHLQGMDVPDARAGETSVEQMLACYASSRLFLQSAERVDADFAFQPGDIHDLAQLCRLTDGMPLALELAAGWVEMLSLGDIAAEIRLGLDFLESDTVDLPDRHRSMEAILESTWRRLEPVEKDLFARLCIFRGGFNRQAAREITDSSLRQLAGLMNKSLVFFDRKSNRYHIHRLLRHFGLDRLAENDPNEREIKDKHCIYFCEAMKMWREALRGAEQRQAQEEMETDSENLKFAWEWAVSQLKLDFLYESTEAVHLFCQRSGRIREWNEMYTLAADRLELEVSLDAKQVLVRLLARQCFSSHDQADLALVERAIDLIAELGMGGYEVREDKAYALAVIGGKMGWAQGDITMGNQLLSESYDIYRSLNNQSGMAHSLHTMGFIALRHGEFERGEELFSNSHQLFRSVGDRSGELDCLRALSVVSRHKGKFEKSRTLDEQSIAIYREEDNQLDLIDSLDNLGWSLFYLGSFSESQSAFSERDAICEKLGFKYSGLGNAGSAVYSGEYGIADAYRRSELFLDEDFGYSSANVSMLLGWAAMAGQEYVEAAEYFEKAIFVDREQERWHQVGVDLAWQSIALRALNRHDEANLCLCESLRLTNRIRYVIPLMNALSAAAVMLAREGEPEKAIEVYALACTFPHVANSQLFHDVVGEQIATIAHNLSPDVVEAVRARGLERDSWTTVEELLAKLEAEKSQD